MTKGKRISDDPQNIVLKTKDRATQTPIKTAGAPEGLAVLALHVTLVDVLVYKPSDKLWMKKEPDFDYDKRNISVVICYPEIP